MRHLGPADNLKAPFKIFNEGRTALDPVPIVAIRYPVNETDFCGMDVTTDHTVRSPPPRLRHNRVFVVANVFYRVFHLMLQVC